LPCIVPQIKVFVNGFLYWIDKHKNYFYHLVMKSQIEKLRQICDGKEIRVFASRSVPPKSVTFVETYRNCGRKSCVACHDRSKRPHGPYWNLNFVDERGKARSMYVGKKLPDFLPSSHRVVFADVQRFWRLNEEYREANLRHRAEVQRLKKEIETLYEELRISKRQGRKSVGSPEKIFRELVNKYHPDRHRGKTFTAEDVMKDINRLWQKAK
jgi:hypothetical protein